MILKLFAPVLMLLLVALGPAHARDNKAAPRAPDLDPQDLEVIAVMEILRLMDLAKEMELVKDMEHLVEENQNERTED